MSGFLQRAYVLEAAAPSHVERMFLCSIFEVRKVLTWVSGSCVHAEASGVRYRVERFWLKDGFVDQRPSHESIAYPHTLVSHCACRLLEVVR